MKKMINNQMNGIYVPNYTNKSLSILIKLIDDKKFLNELKENAYKSYENLYDFDKVFENIIKNFD